MARNKLMRFLKENKEGLIGGAIIGYVVGKFFIPSDFDFSVVAQSESIIDVAKSVGTTALEFAKTKVILATTIIGATLGAIVDSMFKEGAWRRWFKW